MIAFTGELFALFAAFCYAFGSVAATKNAVENGGRGNAVLLSILLTALLSGGLWLVIGPPFVGSSAYLWMGIAWFVFAGVLGTILGRVMFFRSIELAGAIETGLIRRLIPVFAAVLAIIFLGEILSVGIGLGFVLVFSAVAIVIFGGPRRRAALGEIVTKPSRERVAGRTLALSSAASYGGSYTARKYAMQWLPDPLAGTFIGAITGLVWYCLAAPFNANYRRQFLQLLDRPTMWQLMAAAAISVGQIAQFLALRFTTVTAVAIIGTIEMFFAAWLAAYVFKTEARPGRDFLIASILAMSGVVTLSLASAGRL